ncbi:ribosome recycling factor [bacterium]|nr:ribosome recycling factor [candidate division CSSED10-310 bacterium]
MLEEIYDDARQRMTDTIDHFKRDLSTVRTGRASASLLDNIRVMYYGTPTPINRVATVSTPESNLIVIQPWDQSQLAEIEKALMKSDLGLTPNSDGKIIRLVVPQLTEERRIQLVKMINKQSEDIRIAIRNIRRDANDMIGELQKAKEITEDNEHRGYGEVQKITDKAIARVDELFKLKEKEILST